MHHFFATFTTTNHFSDRRKYVDSYFDNISQKEMFSINEDLFQATCWGHITWPSPDKKCFQRNQFTFIGSARLDNFYELLSECGDKNISLSSELILYLFEKYQENCFERLEGDFGFLIWDAEKEQVWCIKDQVGIRPLFYFKQEDLTVFSSSISSIKAYVDKKHLSINKKYVAKELKNYPVEVGETFFNEIHRLQPAHFIVFSTKNASFIETRYWSFKMIDTSSFSNEKMVFDELRRLFKRAVETRLAGVNIAATQLSGGLDSSAITVLASRIMPKENLHTFSFVLNEKTKAYSERGIDEQVTQNSILDYANLHLENHHLSDGFYYRDSFACYDKSDEIMGGFADSDSIWQDSMYKQAAEFGVELIFSGFPGDEGISNPGFRYYYEYFNQKNWFWMIKYGLKHPYGLIRRFGSYYGAKFFKTHFKGYRKIQENRNLLHADSEFHAQLKDISFAFSSSFRQELIDTVYRAHSCLRSESEGLYASQYGITTAYPMADLRFVQFALSLPIEYFNPEKYSRPLFRTICEGILPDDVRLQKKQNGAMTLAFAEYWKKQQIEDFKNRPLMNSLHMFDTQKVFDETELDGMGRKVVLNKMDYMFEKNLSRDV